MSEWERIRLGDLVTFEYGRALPGEARSGSGYPVIGSSGVTGYHSKAFVSGPGIIVGRKGTVGSITWTAKPSWPIDTAYWVQSRRTLHFRWLYWAMQTLDLDRMDSSTGVPGLNRSEAYRSPVGVPVIKEQERIAEVLDAVDDEISSAEQVIAKLKRMGRGLVGDLLSLVGTPARPLREFLAMRPRNGFSPNESESWTGVLVLGLGCLTAEGFAPRQLKNAPAKDGRYADAWLSDGDLLISRSNTDDMVGLVGRYRDVGVPCIYPDLMMKLTPNDLVRPEFLELVLRDVDAREQVRGISQGTSGSMVKISGASLVKIQVRIPDLAAQDRVLAIFATQKSQLDALERENAKLRLVKRGLMEDLLTGRVRVPDLP